MTSNQSISYTVEAGKSGWNVIRRDTESGDQRVVDTKHSEYAAQLAADRLAGKR